MNKLAYLLPAFALVFALGCTPKESPEDTPPPVQAPASQSGTTAPEASAPAEPKPAGKIVEDYATGVISAPDKARAANAKTEMASLQAVVSSFQAMNGRFPSSLDEVKGDMQSGFDMSRFNYDPATGRVSLR